MAIIGGMDSGFGSQVKLVRTNILVTRMTANTNTDQPLCNMLELVNQRLPLNFQCDYICIGHTSPTAGSITSGVVMTHGEKDNVSLMGPSADSLAKASGLEAHANTLSDVQKRTAPIVHQVTSLAAVTLTADTASDTFDTFERLVLNPLGTGDVDLETSINTDTLLQQAQKSDFTGDDGLDLSGAISDVSIGLTTIDYTDAALNADFIPVGNAAGVTPTTFTSLGSIINNKTFAVLTVTALVQPAQ